MKMLLKLAFRNVFRYKKRTIITFSAISYGLGLMAVGICLYNGANTQAMDNIINNQTAHFKILDDVVHGQHPGHGQHHQQSDSPFQDSCPRIF